MPEAAAHALGDVAAHDHVIAEIDAGGVSVTTAPIAVDGPALATVIEYSTGPPATIGLVSDVFVTDRSASLVITSVSVAVLLAPTGSVTRPGTAAVTVLTTEPLAAGSTVAVNVSIADPPDTRSTVVSIEPVPAASSQTFGVVAPHVHDAAVNAAGNTSLTVTPATFEGPRFVTTIVYVVNDPA